MVATTVGIDIGSISTKVVLGPTMDCEIVRSEVGSHTTPTAISFSDADGGRMIGETANLKASNTLVQLNRFLPGVIDGEIPSSDDTFQSFYRFGISSHNDKKGIIVNMPTFKGEGETTYDAAAVLAMLLGKIRKNVNSTLTRLASADKTSNDNNSSDEIKYILSLPPKSTMAARQVLNDAAYAAGLGNNVQIVNSAACLATAYKRKFPDGRFNDVEINNDEKAKNNVTLVVNIGHSQTSVLVLKLSDTQTSFSPEENDDNDKEKDRTRPMEILSSVHHELLGAGSIDIRLWQHFTSTLPALKGSSIKPASKSGQRLLDACQKLKHLLSQLPDGKVTVENIVNDQDVPINCTRSTLVELCQIEQSSLSNLIECALKQAVGKSHGDGDDENNNGQTKEIVIESVEILGGGCRIPMFQNIIRQTLKKTDIAMLSETLQQENGEMTLSPSLDDTSVALGAAVLGDATASFGSEQPWVMMKNTSSKSNSFFEEDADNSSLPTDHNEYRQKLYHEEQRMTAQDEEIALKGEIRNKLEEHVLQMRSAKYEKHSSLLPDASTLDEHLQVVDDWLFSEDSDNATLAEMQSKLDSTIAKTNEMCSAYFQAIKNEEEAKDRDMEEEAKKAQAEAALAGGDEDEEDHDNRRLPKKRRLEIVMKNKAEANELFSDGNYRHAAARYTKALSHCAKFVDLSPEDLEEVKGVKLSLNLNLALAYFKLEKFDQSLRVCNEAIHIDDASVKALYRRATVFYEKKRWDDASKDLKKASSVAPNDKAIKKLQQNIDLQIKRQKAKEKKMAQKMFG